VFQLGNQVRSIGVRAFLIAWGWILLLPTGWSQLRQEKISFQLTRIAKLPLRSVEILTLSSNSINGKSPQFVVGDKVLHFYSNDGRLRKSQHFPYSIYAIAADSFVGAYYLEPEIDGQKLNWYVFHSTGDKAYYLQWAIGRDQLIPRLFLSNQGTTVIFFPEECLIKFFDSDGHEIHSTVCFEDASFTYERNVAGVFSDDGRWFCLATMENAAVPDTPDEVGRSGSPTLILFDQNGQEQWRVAIDGYWSSHVAVSDHGDYLAVCSYRFDETNGVTLPTTVLFNQEGQEIFSLDFLFRRACFSPEENFLLLADQNQVLLVELKNRELIWRKSFDSIEGLLINTAVAHNAEAIALLFANGKYVQGKFLYENPQLLWLTRNGTELDLQQLSGEKFQNSVLEFSAEGSKVFVGTGSEYFELTKSIDNDSSR